MKISKSLVLGIILAIGGVWFATTQVIQGTRDRQLLDMYKTRSATTADALSGSQSWLEWEKTYRSYTEDRVDRLELRLAAAQNSTVAAAMRQAGRLLSGMPSIQIYEPDYTMSRQRVGCSRKYSDEWSDREWSERLTALQTCFQHEELSWPELFSEALHNFYRYANWGGPEDGLIDDDDVAYTAILGMLQTYHSAFSRGRQVMFYHSLEFSEDFRRKVLPVIYRSPELREGLYAAMMPAVQFVFRKLSLQGQTAYLQILDYASSYLVSPGPEKDIAWLKTLEQGDCSIHLSVSYQSDWKFYGNGRHICTMAFAHFRGKNPSLRKVEAWFVRRMHYDGVPKAVLLDFVRRAKRDLEAVATKTAK